MMKKQKSTNNKGFSLVELIVVIAIMAVLIGVIAPQFVKYVQQARGSADKQNIELLQTAANSVLADPTLKDLDDTKTNTANGTTFTITAPASADDKAVIANAVDIANKGNFQSLLEAALGNDSNGHPKYPIPVDSKGYTFVITVKGSKDAGYSASVKMPANASE